MNFDSLPAGHAWLVDCYYHHSTHSVSVNLDSNVTETSASNGMLNWATMASLTVIAAAVIIAATVVYRKRQNKSLALK